MFFKFDTTMNELNLKAKVKSKYDKVYNGVSYKIWLRSRLSEAQNHRCCWCGCKTTDARNKRTSSTIEHIVCRSHGGTDDIENLAVACSHCNNRRKSYPIEVFMDHIQFGKPLPPETTVFSHAEQMRRHRQKVARKLLKDPAIVWC